MRNTIVIVYIDMFKKILNRKKTREEREKKLLETLKF
jgi:hypothetical protein